MRPVSTRAASAFACLLLVFQMTAAPVAARPRAGSATAPAPATESRAPIDDGGRSAGTLNDGGPQYFAEDDPIISRSGCPVIFGSTLFPKAIGGDVDVYGDACAGSVTWQLDGPGTIRLRQFDNGHATFSVDGIVRGSLTGGCFDGNIQTFTITGLGTHSYRIDQFHDDSNACQYFSWAFDGFDWMPGSTGHATFQPGDVFVSVDDKVQWYLPDGTLNRTLSVGPGGQINGGMAFGTDNSLYVTLPWYTDAIAKLDTSGTQTAYYPGCGGGSPDHCLQPFTIVRDPSGNLFVGQGSNLNGPKLIHKLNPTGTHVDDYTVAADNGWQQGPGHLAFEADGCTIRYANDTTRIRRYDVCARAQRTDFPGTTSNATFNLLMLPNGDMLAADGVDIVRFNPTGGIVRRYDVLGQDEWYALADGGDGVSFWAGASNAVAPNQPAPTLYKISLATGAVLSSINTGTSSIEGIAVFKGAGAIPTCDQEQRQAYVLPNGPSSRVSVEYDPRFIVSPNAYSDFDARARLVAEAIRDRVDYALDQYDAVGLITQPAVTVELSCNPAFAVPFIHPNNGRPFTDAENRWKAPTSWVHEAFDDIVASNFTLPNWDDPGQLWVETADHETGHTAQISQIGGLTAGFRVLNGSGVLFESGAVLDQDLVQDADDTPKPANWGHQYLQFVETLFGSTETQIPNIPGNAPAQYNFAALFQFLGEQSGQQGSTDEARVANFIRRVIDSRWLRQGALADAMGVADPGDDRGLYRAIRDFWAAAYLHGKVNVPSRYEIVDSTTPRPPSSTPQAYPTIPSSRITTLPIGAPVQDNSRKQGVLLFSSTVPGSADWLKATFENTGSTDAFMPTVILPVDATNHVLFRQDLISDGPSRGQPQCVTFRKGSAATLGLVMATTATVDYRVTLADPGAPSIDALGASSDGGRIRIEVRPKFGGVFATCLADRELSATLNGQAATIARIEHGTDRFVVYLDQPGLPSGNATYVVTMGNVSTGSQTVFLQAPDPGPRPVPSESGPSGSLGSISQGQNASTSVAVSQGSRAVGFVVQWQPATVATQVVSPTGRVITDTTVASDVTIARTSTSTEIVVATPESGTWQVQATGTTVPSSTLVTYHVTEYDPVLRSDLSTAAGAGAGTPIIVKAGVNDEAGPILGATVTATVTDPLGVTRIFPLSDLVEGVDTNADDGAYAGRLFGTAQAGQYSVVVRASGLDGAGKPFVREETGSLVLGAMVDGDGDGVADSTETLLGMNPANPADGASDPDGDGLSIAAEIAAGTDPFDADTDHGGEADAGELGAGRDPRNPSDDGAVGQAALLATPQDGRFVRIDVSTATGTGTIHLYRIAGGQTVDLGTYAGAGATFTDGPIADATVTYRAVPIGPTGAVGAPQTSAPVTILADATAPFVRVHLNFDAATTSDRSLNVTFTDVSEPVTMMRMALSPDALETAPWVGFNPSFSYVVPPGEGTYRLYVQVQDASGLVSAPASAGIKVVDGAPPVTSVQPLGAISFAPTIQVPFSATDDVSGINHVDLWVRSKPTGAPSFGAWALATTAASSPFSYTFSAGDGDYEFYSVGVDNRNNVEAAPAVADTTTKRVTVRLGLIDGPGTSTATSLDGGATWSGGSLPATAPMTWNAATAVTASRFVATGAAGQIARTIDGGATWTAPTSGTTASLNGVDAVAGAMWAVGANGTILKSVDDGATWASQTSGTTQPLYAVDAVSTTVVFAVGGNGVILKTTNGGTSWSAQTSGVTTALRGIGVASTTVAWAVGDAGRILTTTNGGTTWTSQSSGVTTSLNAVVAVSTTVAWTVGDGGVIRRTKNSGSTWSSQSAGVTSSLRAISAATSSDAWVSGDDGLIFKTSNSGNGWTQQRSMPGAAIRGIDAFDASNAVAVGDDSGLLTTTTSGTTWVVRRDVRPTATINGAAIASGAFGWTVGDGGSVRQTGDRGVTWVVQDPRTAVQLRGVDAVSGTIAWVCGDRGAVSITANGSTWTAKNIATTTRLNAIDAIDGSTAFVVGDGGYISRTTNGGTGWSTQTSGTTASLAAVALSSATNGWVVGANGVILRTTTGTSWTAQTSGVSAALSDAVAIDASTAWVVGATGTILRTSNGGTTWVIQPSGTTEGLSSIVAYDASRAWVVTATGRVLVTSNGGASWTAVTTTVATAGALVLFK
jgi:photosystem II stability/assembly factor-like uncharacterized protein